MSTDHRYRPSCRFLLGHFDIEKRAILVCLVKIKLTSSSASTTSTSSQAPAHLIKISNSGQDHTIFKFPHIVPSLLHNRRIGRALIICLFERSTTSDGPLW